MRDLCLRKMEIINDNRFTKLVIGYIFSFSHAFRMLHVTGLPVEELLQRVLETEKESSPTTPGHHASDLEGSSRPPLPSFNARSRNKAPLDGGDRMKKETGKEKKSWPKNARVRFPLETRRRPPRRCAKKVQKRRREVEEIPGISGRDSLLLYKTRHVVFWNIIVLWLQTRQTHELQDVQAGKSIEIFFTEIKRLSYHLCLYFSPTSLVFVDIRSIGYMYTRCLCFLMVCLFESSRRFNWTHFSNLTIEVGKRESNFTEILFVFA